MSVERIDTASWACVLCGCTETTPCEGGCSWWRLRSAHAGEICSACAGMAIMAVALGTLSTVQKGLEPMKPKDPVGRNHLDTLKGMINSALLLYGQGVAAGLCADPEYMGRALELVIGQATHQVQANVIHQAKVWRPGEPI